MRRVMQNDHWLARGLLIALFGFVVSGNGGATATLPVSGEQPAQDAAGTPSASDPTTSATLGANEVLAGQIADRIAAAWPSVTSYRAVTTILPTTGTPEATPIVEQSGYAERVVILPDTKSITIRDQGATTEIVLSSGVISKRTTPPDGTAGAWETIDTANIADDDPFGLTYDAMLAPESAPYSGLSARQRARVGTDQGTVALDGQECHHYVFPEVTETGEQIQVSIYLNSADLPCRIETTAGMTISRTDYQFNAVTTLATPES